MRCDVVEGEPGIFPEPVARVMRTIGGLFGGGKRRQTAEDQSPTDEAAHDEPAGGHDEPAGGHGQPTGGDAPDSDDRA